MTRGNHSSAVNSQTKNGSKTSYLHSFAQRLSQRYKERKPADREIILISIPDHRLSVAHLLEQFHGGMMDHNKEPIQPYQELSILLKMGTECMVIYRDQTDALLIIYFKRLRNESLDSLGHQFSVVQTHLSEFRDLRVEEYSLKLRLLMKDIAQYLSKGELLERISRRGQNRHYFILNPDHIGSASKKSICFKPGEHKYEINIEDLSMDRFGTHGASNSVVTAKIPPLSFTLFFMFDFHRNFEKFSGKMTCDEKFETVLRNERGENFVQDRLDIAKFEDYIKAQKKYSTIIEDIIDTMKTQNAVHYFQNNGNLLLLDLDKMQRYIDTWRDSKDIAEWFSVSLMQNKIIFYTAIKVQYSITNVLDVPPNLDKKMDWKDCPGRVLGLFAYFSQEEYRAVVSNLMARDPPIMNSHC